MKIHFSRRKLSSTIPLIFLLVLLFAGMAAASGGEGGAKGWVATDTYRVMNFSVLAIALFFILKNIPSIPIRYSIRVLVFRVIVIMSFIDLTIPLSYIIMMLENPFIAHHP